MRGWFYQWLQYPHLFCPQKEIAKLHSDKLAPDSMLRCHLTSMGNKFHFGHKTSWYQIVFTSGIHVPILIRRYLYNYWIGRRDDYDWQRVVWWLYLNCAHIPERVRCAAHIAWYSIDMFLTKCVKSCWKYKNQQVFLLHCIPISDHMLLQLKATLSTTMFPWKLQ